VFADLLALPEGFSQDLGSEEYQRRVVLAVRPYNIQLSIVGGFFWFVLVVVVVSL